MTWLDWALVVLVKVGGILWLWGHVVDTGRTAWRKTTRKIRWVQAPTRVVERTSCGPLGPTLPPGFGRVVDPDDALWQGPPVA